MESAEKEAKRMLKTGEITKLIPHGRNKGMYISTDKNALLAIDVIILEGRYFFVGPKRQIDKSTSP